MVEDLYHRYVSFQSSFNKLLVEIGRRRQYREAAEKIVDGMMAQLEAMTEGKSISDFIYACIVPSSARPVLIYKVHNRGAPSTRRI